MSIAVSKEVLELDEIETREWLDSLDYVIGRRGPERARELLAQLDVHAQRAGVKIPFTANTPYINTIPVEQQPVYPGSREIERRIKSLVRWNALAMVVRANRAALRDFFEVDYRFITLATLVALSRKRKIKTEIVKQAMRDLEIDPEKANPRLA